MWTNIIGFRHIISHRNIISYTLNFREVMRKTIQKNCGSEYWKLLLHKRKLIFFFSSNFHSVDKNPTIFNHWTLKIVLDFNTICCKKSVTHCEKTTKVHTEIQMCMTPGYVHVCFVAHRFLSECFFIHLKQQRQQKIIVFEGYNIEKFAHMIHFSYIFVVSM